MIVIWILLGFLFVCFGLIVLVGAPYVPTRQKDLEALFAALKLKKGAVVVDLGSGDGRVLVAAAKANYKATGYELNPCLWLISLLRTRRYGNRVSVRLHDLWEADLHAADVVFVFTAKLFVKRLSRKFAAQLRPGAKVVSYGFELQNLGKPQKVGSALIYTVAAK